ncbi:hypothetical protein ANTQUA_LOCUS6759 [Anthophora quadrimaculata]
MFSRCWTRRGPVLPRDQSSPVDPNRDPYGGRARRRGAREKKKNEIESGLSGAHWCTVRGGTFARRLLLDLLPLPPHPSTHDLFLFQPHTIANPRCSLQAFRGIVLAFLVRLSTRKVSSGLSRRVNQTFGPRQKL